jgi:hypothetical protein
MSQLILVLLALSRLARQSGTRQLTLQLQRHPAAFFRS